MPSIYSVLYVTPRNYLSFLIGKLVRVEKPAFLARLALRVFVRLLHIKTNEAEREVDTYSSIGAYFVRRLRPGLRPIESDIVSPVDGVHRDSGSISGGTLLQVKGKRYSIAALLGDSRYAERFHSGCFSNLYLTPRHYHRVHVPVQGAVIARTYCPGTLWPVNDWSLHTIDRLFCINERVTTYLDTDYGFVAVVMVGATNVGKMTVTYDDIVTNQPPFADRNIDTRLFPRPLPLEIGAELGTFHMGSTVVLLFERSFRPVCAAGQEVRVGQTLFACASD